MMHPQVKKNLDWLTFYNSLSGNSHDRRKAIRAYERAYGAGHEAGHEATPKPIVFCTSCGSAFDAPAPCLCQTEGIQTVMDFEPTYASYEDFVTPTTTEISFKIWSN